MLSILNFSNIYLHSQLKSLNFFRCEMACPRDCEVGQWDPWGPCLPSQCPLKNYSSEESQIGKGLHLLITFKN